MKFLVTLFLHVRTSNGEGHDIYCSSGPGIVKN